MADKTQLDAPQHLITVTYVEIDTDVPFTVVQEKDNRYRITKSCGGRGR